VFPVPAPLPHPAALAQDRIAILPDALEAQTFYGKTLEEALAWCLVWLTAADLGSGPFGD
jgi:hypothetical protein